MKMKTNISPGFYLHFKGMKYEVIDIATHSESLESYVVYRKCYDDYSLWVRPITMFEEEVTHLGKKVKRFQRMED